jgi:sialate O-acetylesterase
MKTISAVLSLVGAGLVLLAASSATAAAVRLPALVGDNMVVQRGVKARVWGWADPGDRVTVSMAGKSATATAGSDGRWEARVGPYDAGGPYEMTIAGKNTVVLKNVLVGEVWVGSGQSNMEFQLQNSANGADEVARASHPEIHLFTVTKAATLDARDDVEGRWVVCTPENAAGFSAVAYFFGRELNEKLRVPVGLVHSSWGGTPAEAWTSRGALLADDQLKPMVAALDRSIVDLPAATREYQAAQAKWEEANFLQDTGDPNDARRAAVDLADDGWKTMRLPQFWESAGLAVDGAVWFRKTVDVPAAWAGKELTLSLGPVDDFDVTYVNGVKVGAIGKETPNYYMTPRTYTVPGSLVRAGRNVIAVRVFDHYGNGGFGGTPAAMALAAPGSEPISLAGDWRYDVERGVDPVKADYSTAPVAPPGAGNPNSPTVLYNAMVAPLTPYSIRGVIWYQGEANADRAAQYRTLFPTMIRDWRRAWGEGDFPFLFVQLANFQERKAEPGESAWAELREAQTATLAEPATGMAVIIDIGEAGDIHPKNKLDVGHRLALWALAKTYGQKGEYSGPLYDSMTVEGDRARVRFSHADGLKTTDGGPVQGFAVAGADGKFVWATATIDKNDVVVRSDAVAKPVAVRYAWADNPATNLTNGAGLPASPFRTDGPKR